MVAVRIVLPQISCACSRSQEVTHKCCSIFSCLPHRATFKLSAKIVFLLRHLIKKMSAFFGADTCNFWVVEKAVSDLNWIGGDISSDRANNPEHFGHFRFPIPVPHLWLWRRILDYEKVQQIWTLQCGHSSKISFFTQGKGMRWTWQSFIFLFLFLDYSLMRKVLSVILVYFISYV